ncbi:MAG: TIGR04540 family protein [Clostridium sp.]
MDKSEIRLYYKNQQELSYALRDYIDAYFKNKVEDKELEEKITSVIEANKTKFYKNGEIAKKPKQILGKARLDVLEQILSKKGVK